MNEQRMAGALHLLLMLVVSGLVSMLLVSASPQPVVRAVRLGPPPLEPGGSVASDGGDPLSGEGAVHSVQGSPFAPLLVLPDAPPGVRGSGSTGDPGPAVGAGAQVGGPPDSTDAVAGDGHRSADEVSGGAARDSVGDEPDDDAGAKPKNGKPKNGKPKPKGEPKAKEKGKGSKR